MIKSQTIRYKIYEVCLLLFKALVLYVICMFFYQFYGYLNRLLRLLIWIYIPRSQFACGGSRSMSRVTVIVKVASGTNAN